jgi:hypothetical protein
MKVKKTKAEAMASGGVGMQEAIALAVVFIITEIPGASGGVWGAGWVTGLGGWFEWNACYLS